VGGLPVPGDSGNGRDMRIPGTAEADRAEIS